MYVGTTSKYFVVETKIFSKCWLWNEMCVIDVIASDKISPCVFTEYYLTSPRILLVYILVFYAECFTPAGLNNIYSTSLIYNLDFKMLPLYT